MILSVLCICIVVLGAAFAFSAKAEQATQTEDWSDRELALIQSLSLESLGPPPSDPSNAFADDPNAAALGERVFFDPRFSLDGTVSCNSCHRPDYGFSDPNTLSVGIGVTKRRSMPLIGLAYQNWFAWDGKNDSLWAQSLDPFEDPREHGFSREQVVDVISEHYAEEYEAIFGPLPVSLTGSQKLNDVDTVETGGPSDEVSSKVAGRLDSTRVFVNIGKSLAAYLRTLTPKPTAFDLYAAALHNGETDVSDILSPDQINGLRHFIGAAKCVNCHNGPLLSNGAFHSVGILPINAEDQGRAAVVEALQGNEFGFFSQWSDADPTSDGAHLRYLDMRTERARVNFKTPSLRGVSMRPPYMHAGQLASLKAVLDHYRDVSGSPLADENFHGALSEDEAREIEAFLHSLAEVPHD